MKVSSFFKNKYVLYILSFIAMVNLLGYVSLEDYNSLALFIIMLLLSRYFSKSWALNILISILVTSVVAMSNKVREGYKGMSKKGMSRSASNRLPGQKLPSSTLTNKSNTKNNTKSNTKSKGNKLNLSREPPMFGQKIGSAASGKNTGLKTKQIIHEKPKEEKPKEEEQREEEERREEERREEERREEEEEREKEQAEGKQDGETCKSGVECSSGGCNDGICGPAKKPERFKNNVPSSSPSAVNGEEEDTNVAAKMEDAYNNLNKILGDGAMKSMAKETKQLVNQQKELMSTLNSMTPGLNKAKETLAGLKLPSIEKMTGILKRFNQ
tara:strand:- start:88 stop:1068 length:981 start_codon:yes stop_codon:yes gene_type:complete